MAGRINLLLHTCCAPCLSGSLPQLPSEIRVTSLFFNPNITIQKEHDIRLDELKRYSSIAKFPYIIDETDRAAWHEAVRPYSSRGEGSVRCEVCFRFRLERTFQMALNQKYDCVATTLTLSPHKNASLINSIGSELSKRYGIEYLETDFKKRDGFRISVQASKKYSFYRQNYCGCIYSKNESEARANKKAVM